MREFKHLMIDIETLGTKPGCVILSIGAVAFNLDTGRTGPEFYDIISLESSVDAGFTIDPKTLVWWLQQKTSSLKDIIIENKPITSKSQFHMVMRNFYDFIQNLDIFMELEVWGNSNRFDMGILEPYFSKAGLGLPWQFRNERDVRTLVRYGPEIKEKMVQEAKDEDQELHNAIVDCHLQIKYCVEIHNKIIN